MNCLIFSCIINVVHYFFCRPDGSRQKKRVRLPHNTMERQRQKVLQDGEYIMYETPPQRQVSFHLPPETNGYGKLLKNNYIPTYRSKNIYPSIKEFDLLQWKYIKQYFMFLTVWLILNNFVYQKASIASFPLILVFWLQNNLCEQIQSVILYLKPVFKRSGQKGF